MKSEIIFILSSRHDEEVETGLSVLRESIRREKNQKKRQKLQRQLEKKLKENEKRKTKLGEIERKEESIQVSISPTISLSDYSKKS